MAFHQLAIAIFGVFASAKAPACGVTAVPLPLPTDRIKEHIKCLVGAGISVYTAFFAFGAVRFIPELALQPGLWAVPLIVGLTLIIYHQRVVTRPQRRKWRVA